MNKTTRLKKPQIPELDTLYKFDDLGGRPKYGGVEMTSETDIPSFQEIMDETHSAVVAEATARDDADEELQAQIDALDGDLADETSARQAADQAEADARGAADNVLQSEIDAIVASSDVKDIVGTKAELDAYDTSTLGDNDIIKVLQDESQSDATTYYRYVQSTDSFTLIGAEGPYYTKSETNAALNLKADKATTYTKTEVDTALNAKQDTLTAGDNITINNNVISADGLVTLSYGHSTWQDFINAYNSGKIVYCRASSNADPSINAQSRLAFMAYVSNPTNPTTVEFQYVRSVSPKTEAQQMDQVFVYKLTNANGGTWTVTTRDMTSKVVAGNGLSSTYSNGVLTLAATGGTEEISAADWSSLWQ